MIYRERLIISKEDVEFANTVMQISDETDPRWEDYEDCRDREVESYYVGFKDGCFASISLASGTSNFFIDPCLFNKDGYELCVLDCADELLGEYEFEADGNTYIAELVLEEEN